MKSLVQVQQLHITTKQSTLLDIAFDIYETTALVGESGSGKSLCLKALLQMLPSSLQVTLKYESAFQLTSQNIGFVPQNPFTSLSPMTPIKKQFFCAYNRMLEMIQTVGLPLWVLDRFPSELSGGQLQRVVIAIALSTQPKILLLDEPTTALDSQNKANIIQLLHSLHSKLGIALFFVTHDIDSIQELCKHIIVIKDGSIVQKGLVEDILQHPTREYTQKLINANFSQRSYRV